MFFRRVCVDLVARRRFLFGILLVLACFAGCKNRDAIHSERELESMRASARKQTNRSYPNDRYIVVIALDGVRWQEVFRGADPNLSREARLARGRETTPERLMPKLHALIRERGIALGARGAPISATGPSFVSLPGYTEILSGRPVPNCHGNHCTLDRPTLLDEIAAMPEVAPEDVAVVASWEGIENALAVDQKVMAISVGRVHGATRQRFAQDPRAAELLANGEHAGPNPGIEDFRRDRETAQIALHHFDAYRPRFMLLELGEPDEWAHLGDYAHYLDSLSY